MCDFGWIMDVIVICSGVAVAGLRMIWLWKETRRPESLFSAADLVLSFRRSRGDRASTPR